jgi:hypothetical protein
LVSGMRSKKVLVLVRLVVVDMRKSLLPSTETRFGVTWESTKSAWAGVRWRRTEERLERMSDELGSSCAVLTLASLQWHVRVWKMSLISIHGGEHQPVDWS